MAPFPSFLPRCSLPLVRPAAGTHTLRPPPPHTGQQHVFRRSGPCKSKPPCFSRRPSVKPFFSFWGLHCTPCISPFPLLSNLLSPALGTQISTSSLSLLLGPSPVNKTHLPPVSLLGAAAAAAAAAPFAWRRRASSSSTGFRAAAARVSPFRYPASSGRRQSGQKDASALSLEF